MILVLSNEARGAQILTPRTDTRAARKTAAKQAAFEARERMRGRALRAAAAVKANYLLSFRTR